MRPQQRELLPEQASQYLSPHQTKTEKVARCLLTSGPPTRSSTRLRGSSGILSAAQRTGHEDSNASQLNPSEISDTYIADVHMQATGSYPLAKVQLLPVTPSRGRATPVNERAH